MRYNCALCKTSKSFVNPGPTETAYCHACEHLSLFLPDTSSVPTRRSPERHRASGSSLYRSSDDFDHGKRSSSFRSIEYPSATSSIRSSSTASIRPCDYFKLCLEFMLTMDCSKKLFNRKHNRCYCSNCYSLTSKDSYIEGGARYVIPRGWVRFGLYIDDAQAAAEKIWSRWVVSYHGTSPTAAKSIIEHHQFLLPRDRCISGDVIGIRDGHIPDKFEVYTSPTIAYSGDDIYSSSTRFHSKIRGQSYKAKVVLQCRQKPGSFKIQAETIGATAKNRRICPVIRNTEVEYFTQARPSIIPYGLLIRVF